MRICIYEDSGVALLEPLALTRPAFALLCGARPILDRQRAALGACETGLWVRPELVELCAEEMVTFAGDRQVSLHDHFRMRTIGGPALTTATMVPMTSLT